MKKTLELLFEHKSLSREQSAAVLHQIANGACNQSQIAAFLSVYLMRSITVGELEGFRDALLELCIRVDFSDYETIDLCGTGGDAKNTFNISTLASIITAASGIKVAKHGNYGVSSISGSSNVMECLGYRFTNDVGTLERQLDKTGICFMHAPLFHPAMKAVAPVRKELGMKTFFNMLGPLVNPSFPKFQLTGVFNLELARLYQYLLQQGQRNFMLVHSLDGYDELSLTSAFKLISNTTEQLLHPQEIGLPLYAASDLLGADTVDDSAKLFMKILQGEGSAAQNDVVCANAALAISLVKKNTDMESALALARESLESKKALNLLTKLLSHEYA